MDESRVAVDVRAYVSDTVRPKALALADDGAFPNNARLPLLVYRHAFALPATGDRAAVIEQVFHSHGWNFGCWRNNLYSYHHYHSTAHEVLGVYAGHARVQFGGPHGVVVETSLGDVIVVPAGVAHKRLGGSANFAVVGCYPKGQDFDMNYGDSDERPEVDRNIAAVHLPDTDPVFGEGGPLVSYWRAA